MLNMSKIKFLNINFIHIKAKTSADILKITKWKLYIIKKDFSFNMLAYLKIYE